VSRFALAGVLLVALAGVAGAEGPLLVNGAGDPLVWTTIPVPFNADRGTLGALDNATAIAHVAQNFGVWAAVPTASISAANAGALPVDVTAANYTSYLGVCNDGLSPIIFDTDGSITDDVFGAGASNSVLGFAGPECGTYVPPVITEGSAVLNGKWIDGVSGSGNPEIPVTQFDGVFVHEFGHYLDLDHSQINLTEALDGDASNNEAIATMFPFLVSGTNMSTLTLDDRVAISTLYPAPSFATGFGTITGSVRRSGGTPFQGAFVIARKVSDPRITAVGVVSGARYFPTNQGGPPDPSLEGSYELPGLPAGSYTVEVEPVFGAFTGGSSVGPLDPPALLPGPPEFWNGANEAGTNPPDDPSAAVPVAVTAGATVSGIDIVLNASNCSATPVVGCKIPIEPGRSSISLHDQASDAHDIVDWKWAGEATTKSEYGDPTATTGYELCVYDTTSGTATVVLAASAPAGPDWRGKTSGYSYRSRTLAPDGVSKISLRAGGDGKARISLKAKGTNVGMPTLPLSQDSTVIVQLVNGLGTCWEATYTTPPQINDTTLFKDRND